MKHQVILLLSDGRVSCLDSYSGDKIWSQALRGENSDFVGKINTTPIVSAGKIFIVNAAKDLISLQTGDGKEEWEGGRRGSRDVKAVEDVIIYYAESHRGRVITAINAVTKEERWVLSLDEWSIKHKNPKWSTPVYSQGKIWILGGAGYLLGIDIESGKPVEIYASPLFRYYAHSPVVIGSSLYVAAGKKGLMIVS